MLIGQYQTRGTDAWQKTKLPTLGGLGAVIVGTAGVVMLSVFLWIVLGLGVLAILVGIGRGTCHLIVHRRVGTVHAIYGRDTSGGIDIDGSMLRDGHKYVYRHDSRGRITTVNVDERLLD